MAWSTRQILERLLSPAHRDSPPPAAPVVDAGPRQLYIVYYDELLNIVEKEAAAYELRFYNGVSLEWKLLAGTREDSAHFSIESYVSDWSEEEWAKFPLNIASQLIPRLVTDPSCRCGFGFRWINSSWHERYRMFLSTHRGSLDRCEQVFTWAIVALVPQIQTFSQACWTIAIKQSDLSPTNSFLWSQIKRDFTLTVDGRALELSDDQLKLLRIIHCCFMPFYVEDTRRHHECVFQWEKKEAAWSFEVSAPSQHECLEALLNLREWLKDKVPATEIDSLLAPKQ